MARPLRTNRRAQLLTSREIGVLAAIGLAEVEVYRRPRVAIVSTGNEIIAPGSPLRTGAVYDSNAAIIAAVDDITVGRRELDHMSIGVQAHVSVSEDGRPAIERGRPA